MAQHYTFLENKEVRKKRKFGNAGFSEKSSCLAETFRFVPLAALRAPGGRKTTDSGTNFPTPCPPTRQPSTSPPPAQRHVSHRRPPSPKGDRIGAATLLGSSTTAGMAEAALASAACLRRSSHADPGLTVPPTDGRNLGHGAGGEIYFRKRFDKGSRFRIRCVLIALSRGGSSPRFLRRPGRMGFRGT